MNLDEIIINDNIELNLSSENKEQVLKDLIRLLLKTDVISDEKLFFEDVLEREAVSTTGIGFNVAIPHGKSKSVKKTSIAIGKTKKYIDWGSLDNLPVKFIILLAVAEDDKNTNHIKLLSQIATKLADEETCKKLLNVETKENLLEIFSN